MKIKRLAAFAFIFVVGTIVGGLGSLCYFAKSVSDASNIRRLIYSADWGQRAMQAYLEEEPPVAIWALENYADVLTKQAEWDGNHDDIFKKDLMLTYGRLAISSRAAQDDQSYDRYIAKALMTAEKAYSPELRTEKELLDFVKQVDEIGRRKPGVKP